MKKCHKKPKLLKLQNWKVPCWSCWRCRLTISNRPTFLWDHPNSPFFKQYSKNSTCISVIFVKVSCTTEISRLKFKLCTLPLVVLVNSSIVTWHKWLVYITGIPGVLIIDILMKFIYYACCILVWTLYSSAKKIIRVIFPDSLALEGFLSMVFIAVKSSQKKHWENDCSIKRKNMGKVGLLDTVRKCYAQVEVFEVAGVVHLKSVMVKLLKYCSMVKELKRCTL